MEDKHYFVTKQNLEEAESDRFCAVCDKYLTDETHFRTPNSSKE